MRCLKDELENIPTGIVDTSILESAKNIAAARISELAKKEKFHHFNLRKLRSFKEREAIIDFYGGLFDGVPQETRSLLVFIYWLHDIGFCDTGINNEHGRAAVKLLREWGVTGLFEDKVRQAIEYAIEYHCQPQLPQPESSELKDTFARVLRDWDKLGGFVYKSDGWLFDENAKAKEAEYCHAAGETGAIKPANILEEFQKLGYIDKKHVVDNNASYEAIILLYLAWIFDVNYRETLEVLINLKIPDKFFKYFKKQLGQESSQFQIINNTFKKFLKHSHLN